MADCFQDSTRDYGRGIFRFLACFTDIHPSPENILRTLSVLRCIQNSLERHTSCKETVHFRWHYWCRRSDRHYLQSCRNWRRDHVGAVSAPLQCLYAPCNRDIFGDRISNCTGRRSRLRNKRCKYPWSAGSHPWVYLSAGTVVSFTGKRHYGSTWSKNGPQVAGIPVEKDFCGATDHSGNENAGRVILIFSRGGRGS